MKKRERDRLLPEGRKRLSEWGIGPASGEAELRGVLGRDAAADLAVAEWLGGTKEPWALSLLAEIEQRATQKVVRREVQRSRFRLAQRGLAPLISTREPTPVFPSREATFQAYLSDFGLRDLRVALILREELAQTESIVALFSPERIEHASFSHRSRRKVERAYRQICTELLRRPFEADWRHVDFLLWRAEQSGLQQQEGRGQTTYAPVRRRWFGEAPPEEVAPPIYALLDSEAVRNDAQALAASAQLVHHPSFAPFAIDPLAETYATKWIEARQSPLVLNELQIADRQRDVIREAVEAFFSAEPRTRWIHRLEELAYAFYQWGQMGQARQCFAVALALRDDPTAHERLAFCHELVQAAVSLAVHALQEAEREKAKERLIVPPPSPSGPGRRP